MKNSVAPVPASLRDHLRALLRAPFRAPSPRAPWRPALLTLLLLPLAVTLSGCLEVEQHPAWRDGAYDGKVDDRPEHRHYAHDRLAWHAALVNRNHLQNEYRRLP